MTSQESRLTGITVGTDFDPKELMFRNYLGMITQDSKPAARISFSAGEKEVFSVGWLDPSGRLVAKNKLQVKINAATPHSPLASWLGYWILTVLTCKRIQFLEYRKIKITPTISERLMDLSLIGEWHWGYWFSVTCSPNAPTIRPLDSTGCPSSP